MSLFGSREKEVTGAEISQRVSDLRAALDAGGDRLDPAVTDRARTLVRKVGERQELGSGYTVVALAGATGSGKSSLFNRIVGSDVAQVGVRRPTTSTATAAIWGPDSAARLLDWLGVGARHQLGGSGSLDGLVLLDLPDFDSHEAGNRAEADRVLGLADVFVWVTDPQKYADAVLHDDYIKALSTKDTRTVVLLNQADRLTVEQVEQCIADLQRILRGEGVTNATVLPISATTGAGVDVLMASLADVVVAQNAAHLRLQSDVRDLADRLSAGVAEQEPTLDEQGSAALVDALARAAGVPVVVGAVQRDYSSRASAYAGWPFTKWLRKLRPDPLRRLGLGGGNVAGSGGEASGVPLQLGRSSLPSASPAQRSAVDLACRDLADRAGAGLPLRWTQAIERAAMPAQRPLSDALDQAVMSTPLRARTPVWWRVVGVLQWLFAVTALAGLAWLLVLIVLGWLQIHVETPAYGPIPYPTLLLAGGLLLGLLTTAVVKACARVGARRAAERARSRLYRAIAGAAQQHVVAPVRAVLDDHRRAREHLTAARAR